MNKEDMECPYCGEGQEVNHDDGAGYSESETHQHQCTACDKYFVFYTAISFSYDANKADCLNGQPHKFKFSKAYPHEHSKMRCLDCDEERKPTKDEWIAAGFVNGKPEPFKISPVVDSPSERKLK